MEAAAVLGLGQRQKTIVEDKKKVWFGIFLTKAPQKFVNVIGTWVLMISAPSVTFMLPGNISKYAKKITLQVFMLLFLRVKCNA